MDDILSEEMGFCAIQLEGQGDDDGEREPELVADAGGGGWVHDGSWGGCGGLLLKHRF